jgi:hypothetical protein
LEAPFSWAWSNGFFATTNVSLSNTNTLAMTSCTPSDRASFINMHAAFQHRTMNRLTTRYEAYGWSSLFFFFFFFFCSAFVLIS